MHYRGICEIFLAPALRQCRYMLVKKNHIQITNVISDKLFDLGPFVISEPPSYKGFRFKNCVGRIFRHQGSSNHHKLFFNQLPKNLNVFQDGKIVLSHGVYLKGRESYPNTIKCKLDIIFLSSDILIPLKAVKLEQKLKK